MGTRRLCVALAAAFLVAVVFSGAVAYAGDGERSLQRVAPATVPAGYVQPVSTSPGASQPAASLYEDEWRPGMIVRSWRVPASTQPGLPAPQDEDFTNFPPCPPAPGAPPAPAPIAPPATMVEEVPMPQPPVYEQPRITRNTGGGGLAMPQLGGVCDPECAQRRDECCWPVDNCGVRYGRFELTLEGMASIPSSPDGLLGEPVPGASDQFDWESLDYGIEFGARGTVRYAVSPGKWLEGRFTWYGDKYSDSADARPGRFGFSPGVGIPPTGVSAASLGAMSASAELWSAELNFVGEFECSGCWRWDLILGARMIQFDEKARLDFATGPIVGAGPAFVDSDVTNHLIGGQLGLGAHWDVSSSVTLNFSLKAIMGDLSRKADVTDTSIFVGGPHASRLTQTEMVFGTDIEIGLRWRLTRCIAFTLGYNMLFLDNVLRANDAMDFTKSTSGAVQAKDDVDQLIVHSVFAGLNFNF